MARRPIAEDAFLLSETGPVSTKWLEPGRDRIWTVDRNGAFALVVVDNVKAAAEVDAQRLVTTAGDIVVPEGSLVMTSEGPMTGAEVESGLRRGRAVRLDVVSPTDLPRPKPRRVAERDALRSALAALPDRMIQLPQSNGVADAVSAEVERLLNRADVRYRRAEDEKWTVFTLEAIRATADGSRAEFGTQADVLGLATAWVVRDEGVESRVRLVDHRLRRRLLAGLVGAARGYEVKWLPGYRPVESRVRPLAGRDWPARVPVTSALRGRARVALLEIGDEGDPIVSLAVLSPRHS
jgi:hypothetical protein